MTDPILRLDPERLSVEPGGMAVLTLTVTNPGTIVEGYAVDVVSTMPMPWAQVEPATLSVYPQQEATAVITFSPPSGPGAPGGSVPFGVRVWSEVAGGGSAVAEGDLDIGSVEGLQAKLTPLASTGRWSGRHTLRVSNWGNAPARLRLVPEDPAQALGFLVAPEVLDIPLGGEATSRIKVRTRHPVLRGSLQRLPFQIACEPDVPADAAGPVPVMSTASRPVVDGAFNQKPILTRFVVMVAGLVALALIAGLFWLLTRQEKTPEADKPEQPGAPANFAAVASQGTDAALVTFTWAKAVGVQKYELKQTAPENDQKEIPFDDAADDPASLQSTIKVETSDHYCYRLVAVRDGATPSPPSDEKCVDTQLPATAPPEPTGPPTIVPVDPGGGDGTSESPTGTTTLPPSADPLEFVTVLQFFPVVAGAAPDPSDAEAARAELKQKGFDTKVLYTDEWTFTATSTGPPPTSTSFALYVDGANVAEAQSKCITIYTADQTSAPDGCNLSYSVVAK